MDNDKIHYCNEVKNFMDENGITMDDILEFGGVERKLMEEAMPSLEWDRRGSLKINTLEMQDEVAASDCEEFYSQFKCDDLPAFKHTFRCGVLHRDRVGDDDYRTTLIVSFFLNTDVIRVKLEEVYGTKTITEMVR